MQARYRNRAEGGEVLARALSVYKGADIFVLALPRGGVPVAREVARSLNAPLDVWLVRKIGMPGHEELAVGAISTGGVRYLDHELVARMQVPDDLLKSVIAREEKELERREALYRGGRAAPVLAGKTVIVVDDGLATGATMRAAVESLRHARPARIVVAVPVGAAQTCLELAHVADDVVCPSTPEPFYGVGQWYDDFGQTTDGEVLEILRHAPQAFAGEEPKDDAARP